MTPPFRPARRLAGIGAAFVMFASSACAYMEFSPPPAKRKPLVAATVTPNPPRPGPTGGVVAGAIAEDPIAEAQIGEAPLAEVGRDSSSATPGAPLAHVVRRGETLYAISRAYGVEVAAFARYNDLAAPFAIYDGQRLSIPPAGAAPARPPYPAEIEEAPMVARLPAVAGPLPPPPARSGGGFVWPADGRILSTFGPKARGLRNDGINIETRRGDPIRAIDNGVVAYAGNELRGFGNMILIKHQGGWVSTYAHNDRLLVSRGERVRRGQTIARAGSTGRADGPQLHFELRKGMTPVDPLAHLPAPPA